MGTHKIRIGIAKLNETGSISESSFSKGPEAIEKGGLLDLFKNLDCFMEESKTAHLSDEEKKQYGVWHKLGLASNHLANIVSSQINRSLFSLGLLANCNGLMGMLAGIQHSANSRPLRVGLVWIDAHGDYNTPETTLSGMLGGMPVAIATGLCLRRLRLKCGLDPALPSRYVTMVGVRDTDPLEQELLDRSNIQHITVDEVKRLSPAIELEMERLSTITDMIYVHVDMDVLDPEEVQGHDLTVENGPSSDELGNALEIMFEYPKTVSFGVASYPATRDNDGRSLKAVYNLIEGVIRGLKNREN